MNKVSINICWMRDKFITGPALYPGDEPKGTFIYLILEALWRDDYIDGIYWTLKQKV